MHLCNDNWKIGNSLVSGQSLVSLTEKAAEKKKKQPPAPQILGEGESTIMKTASNNSRDKPHPEPKVKELER